MASTVCGPSSAPCTLPLAPERTSILRAGTAGTSEDVPAAPTTCPGKLGTDDFRLLALPLVLLPLLGVLGVRALFGVPTEPIDRRKLDLEPIERNILLAFDDPRLIDRLVKLCEVVDAWDDGIAELGRSAASAPSSITS